MMKKQKGIWLKYLIYATGLLAGIVFVLIRFDRLPEAILVDGIEDHGELYHMSYIDLFAVKIEDKSHYRERLFTPERNINEAEILAFGDSFFTFPLEKPFSLRLADTLNKEVYYANGYYALEYLDTVNYIKSEPKVLILDVVERYIPLLFSARHKKFLDQNRFQKKGFLNKIFLDDTERKYTVLLQKSIFTNYLYSRVNTIKFNLLGYLPSIIPKFSRDPLMVFHIESVNDNPTSAYFEWKDEEIEEMCDNILVLSNALKKEYNLELLLMPMPNPYTIYRDLIGDTRYNDLLPRLYKGLSERNIWHIALMDEYLAADEMVYHGTDTHWNKKGQDIALRLVLKELEAFEKRKANALF